MAFQHTLDRPRPRHQSTLSETSQNVVRAEFSLVEARVARLESPHDRLALLQHDRPPRRAPRLQPQHLHVARRLFAVVDDDDGVGSARDLYEVSYLYEVCLFRFLSLSSGVSRPKRVSNTKRTRFRFFALDKSVPNCAHALQSAWAIRVCSAPGSENSTHASVVGDPKRAEAREALKPRARNSGRTIGKQTFRAKPNYSPRLKSLRTKIHHCLCGENLL